MDANKNNQDKTEEYEKDNSLESEVVAEENNVAAEQGEQVQDVVEQTEAIPEQTEEFAAATVQIQTEEAKVESEAVAEPDKDKPRAGWLKQKARHLLVPVLTVVAGLAIFGVGILVGSYALGAHPAPPHPPAHGPAAEKHLDKREKHSKPDKAGVGCEKCPEGMRVFPGERHLGRVDEANPKESQTNNSGVKMVVIPKAEYEAILKAVKERNGNQ